MNTMLVMSPATRQTTSLGVVAFLITTMMLMLILICSPPTVSVIRSEAVASGDEEDESAENYYGVGKSLSWSSADVGERMPAHDESYDHPTEFAVQEQQRHDNNDLLRSNIADSHLGWRGGILFATQHEDRDRIDNTSPALLGFETNHHLHVRNNGRPSVSEGRNLRDRTRRRRPRRGRSSQEEHWCECIL